MSVNIETILNEIQKGNIVVESSDDYRLPYPLGLTNIPFLAEDGATGIRGKYDQSCTLTNPIL
ncbi:MAG: hypothetical protein OEV79_11580 [candidate division WOR-3 bacterium]|nr:hypothetical protein [candidate division WOR-3 bacterium]